MSNPPGTPDDDGLPPDLELLAREYEDYGFIDPLSPAGRRALPVVEDYGGLVRAVETGDVAPDSLDPAVLAIVAPHLVSERPLEPAERGSLLLDPTVLEPWIVSAAELEALGIRVPRREEEVAATAAALQLERAAEIVRAIEETEADQSRLDAQRARLMAELVQLNRRSPDAAIRLEAASLAASEIAAALRISQRTAHARVEEARALADPAMAPVMAAMRAGLLTRQRAAAVIDAAIPVLSGRLAEFVSAATLIAAPEDANRRPTLAALNRRLRRLAEDYTDEPLAARAAKAAADRRVDVAPTGDGMCHLTAFLPLEVGAVIDTRLSAIARSLHSPDEGRTINQLRADVLVDLLQGRAAGIAIDAARDARVAAGTAAGTLRAAHGTAEAAHGESPAPFLEGAALAPVSSGFPLGGVRLQLVVTAPESTVSGNGNVPGEILGYGPVDAETTRRLAAQASTWTRLVVGARDGAPLSIGRIRYAPTAAMRRFLIARDATCRFPGCDKPAAATEADHTVEWQDGGETGVANLALLCPAHHRLKSLGLWKVRQVGAATPGRGSSSGVSGSSGTSGSRSGTYGSLSDTSGRPSGMPAPPGTANSLPRTDDSPPRTDDLPPGTLEWTAPSGRRHITYPYQEVLPPAPPPF